MIKRTFYNLPAEKRRKIIDVTRKEFQKGNKKKITINTVIQKAGISRGSFYQYFDDKLDLVELITDDMMTKITEFIKDELILNGGDIFKVPMRIFDVMIESTGYEDIVILTDISNRNNDLISEYMQYRFHEPNFLATLSKYVDKSHLNLENKEELRCVVFMMADAIRSAMIHVAKNPKSMENERKILYKKIQLLKRASMATI
ncbi:MAG: TetR/AcrR family transcriptional regulator [Ruminococcus sp.]|nr:TetR/AcrR family transcriptional regulator [Ruminococcus sp.]